MDVEGQKFRSLLIKPAFGQLFQVILGQGILSGEFALFKGDFVVRIAHCFLYCLMLHQYKVLIEPVKIVRHFGLPCSFWFGYYRTGNYRGL